MSGLLANHPLLRFWRPLALSAAVLSLGFAAGCTYSQGEAEVPPPSCDTSAQAVTYAAVISPIFDKHCRECHAANTASSLGGGTLLDNYQAVNRYPSASLLGSIRHSPGYEPMPKARVRIPECDILRIEAWMNAGKPNN